MQGASFYSLFLSLAISHVSFFLTESNSHPLLQQDRFAYIDGLVSLTKSELVGYRTWTPEEIQKLSSAVTLIHRETEQPLTVKTLAVFDQWNRVAAIVKSRNYKQCRNKWKDEIQNLMIIAVNKKDATDSRTVVNNAESFTQEAIEGAVLILEKTEDDFSLSQNDEWLNNISKEGKKKWAQGLFKVALLEQYVLIDSRPIFRDRLFLHLRPFQISLKTLPTVDESELSWTEIAAAPSVCIFKRSPEILRRTWYRIRVHIPEGTRTFRECVEFCLAMLGKSIGRVKQQIIRKYPVDIECGESESFSDNGDD